MTESAFGKSNSIPVKEDANQSLAFKYTCGVEEIERSLTHCLFRYLQNAALHWNSHGLIVISYSSLWCWPDLNILFVRRPYLWSVESLAGWEADKPGNSHLPPKAAKAKARSGMFKAPCAAPSSLRGRSEGAPPDTAGRTHLGPPQSSELHWGKCHLLLSQGIVK